MHSCGSEMTLPSTTTEKLSGIKASQQAAERQYAISESQRRHTFHLCSKSSRPVNTRKSERKIYSPCLTCSVLKITQAAKLGAKERFFARFTAFACDHFNNTPH